MNIIGQTSSDTLKKLKFSNMSLEQAYPETSPLASQEMPQYGGEDPGGYTPQGRILYWYHPDYIQNVDLITDIDGAAYELFLYNPWGEQLHHWTSSSSSWTSPYRFNAKELDPETGLSYYGARYYESKLSVWLSVDPMASKGPNITPYSFSNDNPIMLVDPDGNWPNLPSLVSWFSTVMKKAATQEAKNKYNEIMDRTAQARGNQTNVRMAQHQSISISGSEMQDQLILSEPGGRSNEISGYSNYNINGSQGRAQFRGQRKNSLSLYNVTSISFEDGRKGAGVSGGGMGGYGYMIELGNGNNTVAYMLIESKEEFNQLMKSYYGSIDDQFNKMLDKVPMARDYYDNVHPAFEAANNFHKTTSNWTEENRVKYQSLMSKYNQALDAFYERWNENNN
jgi:RHS repeat-associated protein